MEVVKMNKRMPVSTMLDPKIVIPAIGSSFAKLDPRLMVKNPVMFVVEIVAALTTVIFLKNVVSGGESLAFTFQIILWLWFTVLFANFAEAVAEGRGKAQADSPVIAASLTAAIPSITSPSPGMTSPASTSTTSPRLSFVAATSSMLPPAVTSLAWVSVRVLRRLSACALPRPSAIASAKLANSTVNHSQSAI